MYIDATKGGCDNFEEFLKRRFRISKDSQDPSHIDNLTKGFDFETWAQKIFAK